MRRALSISSFKICRVLLVAAILVLTILGLFLLNRGLMLPESSQRVGPFLESEGDFDVLFFGSSHTVCGVYPVQLWRDYGIRAYNLGSHGQSMAASYWTMRLAVESHKPKIAVLDVYKAGDMDTECNVSYAHWTFDAFPLSVQKWRAVRSVYPQNKQAQAELLFPFRLYHSRWDSFDTKMAYAALGRSADPYPTLGGDMRLSITPYPEMSLVPQTAQTFRETVGTEYAMEFVTFCKENDILPVLVNLPYQADETFQAEVNGLLAKCEEMGALTLNFQYLDLLDPDTDWDDGIDHVNLSGGRKLTAYLGQWLRTLELGEASGQNAWWDGQSKANQAYLWEGLEETEDLRQMLLKLYGSDCTARLTVPADFTPGSVTEKLVRQLGERCVLEKDPALDGCRIEIEDGGGEQEIQKTFSWYADR